MTGWDLNGNARIQNNLEWGWEYYCLIKLTIGLCLIRRLLSSSALTRNLIYFDLMKCIFIDVNDSYKFIFNKKKL